MASIKTMVELIHSKDPMLMGYLLLVVVTLIDTSEQDENENVFYCPCNTGSSESTQYIGNDYYCESGVCEWNWSSDVFFHYDDPLWDGKQCGYLESDCCTTQNIPWFITSFNYWTTDDIELRMCSSEGYPNEATPIDIIELYIR